MFLPITRNEMSRRGWTALDVILVTGDSYIDAPSIGVAVIGRVLLAAGYRVGVIPQPDVHSGADIQRLGEPRLFWGVTGGCVDSMVANYTASGRKRKRDDYTPGGWNGRRPDRAAIVYSHLIRQHFKKTAPLVLGGIEASLRRVAHYDFWSNKIRKSILVDAKADYLLHGMADRSVVELARCLREGADPSRLAGLCYMARALPDDCLRLPSFAETARDPFAFERMFHLFYRNNDPRTARRLAQRQDTRYLVHNPPAVPLSGPELDAVHELDYARDLHPLCREQGAVKALETIRFSIQSHRGCYGECNFCSIAVHQGRAVQARSLASMVAEARRLTRHPAFRGVISDVGGPTANMYGIECARKARCGACPQRRCLVPALCPDLELRHDRQVELLQALRAVPGVRKVVVASGVRPDLVLADSRHGPAYLEALLRHHVSGQMKIAPEHCDSALLALMGKPDASVTVEFKRRFESLARKMERPPFLSYYMIAAHPGSALEDMDRLRAFALRHLKLLPRQIQIFTPTPSTYSTLMYWTERDPFTGRPCFVEKSVRGRQAQKDRCAPASASRPSRRDPRCRTRAR